MDRKEKNKGNRMGATVSAQMHTEKTQRETGKKKKGITHSGQ